MKKALLLFAAVFAAFCFSSCEEEKEEQVDEKQVYYRLYSRSSTENENIYIREYDKNDSCILQSYIEYLGKDKYSDYRIAKPNTDYVIIYCKQSYYDYDNSVYNYYAKMIKELDRSIQYNDLWLNNVEEITEQEFRELQEQKK